MQKCVLAGNSFGGNLAWHMALARPERVDRLILVDDAGYPCQPESMPIGFRIAQLPVLNKVMEYTLPRGMVESSVRNVYGEDAAGIARITLPTLILWGREDHLIPARYAGQFHHDIRGSRLVMLAGLGHVPHEDDPARTVAEVKGFLGLR